MTKQFKTAQERVDFIKQASAARNAAIAAQESNEPKKSAKTTPKKQQKVLSKAAQLRLEKERQEAAKSKVEKLAESIKNRSTIAAKHNSVVKQVAAVKTRNTPVKKARVNKIPKVKQTAPMDRSSSLAVFEAQIEQRNKEQHHLLKQAETIRNRLAHLSDREKVKTTEGLRDCYGIYEFLENSKDGDMLYDIIRSYFKATLEPIQSNTPNEALLVRFIFSKKSKKQVSEYATVLRYARETGIAKNDFVKWYDETTQTRILALARKSSSADSQEKLKRAKIALLRYFDIQEEWPLGHFDYPEHLSAKQVHLPDDLMFVICRCVRKFNRDVYFDPENPAATRVPLAEISALHFIPPNIDLTNDLITRIARSLVPYIDEIEEQINQKSERVWANDMTSLLMERELGSAYKSADLWANRMQASIAEDQIEFEKKRKKIQKLRNQARK
ncbi:hypothetical protein [Polynucleobacter yangtzensis]|uniref:hypothetical protein n=1 Tax=Polynucleobacter yangtzensis TaxID=1743159 RepID=UPI000B01FE1C|nr:hypothetical protein [Polynucleobacter yangtzensis]